jgi:hypothetical protein
MLGGLRPSEDRTLNALAQDPLVLKVGPLWIVKDKGHGSAGRQSGILDAETLADPADARPAFRSPVHAPREEKRLRRESAVLPQAPLQANQRVV